MFCVGFLFMRIRFVGIRYSSYSPTKLSDKVKESECLNICEEYKKERV